MMTPSGLPLPRLRIDGRDSDRPPRCTGLYRMFDDRGTLLYVGKSINIANRLQQHYRVAQARERQRRMLRQVHLIECQPTAGELGALLLENKAIKEERPIYNRRQRQLRQLWTWRLAPDRQGYLVPQLIDLLPGHGDNCQLFGLFASPHAARERLHQIQRERQLCPQVLGLETRRSRCFQRQIGRCRGACHGADPPADFNDRLCSALGTLRIQAWPLTQPLLLREAAQPALLDKGQPRAQWHLVQHWLHLGTFDSPTAARVAAKHPVRQRFDRDCYRILCRALQRGHCELFCGFSLRRIRWPWATQAPL